MSNKYSEILNAAEKYDVITFDVFDTLILRNAVKPVDVFELTHGKLFKYYRILAEMAARKFSCEEDVTLDEIYSFIPFADAADEIAAELKVCCANDEMKEIFSELRKRNKKIYAISDMYLSEQIIDTILKKCGYEVDGVFVSSKYKLTKHSGNLFREFCRVTKTKPSCVLHIGDNEISDVRSAGNVGIKAFHVKKDKNMLTYMKSGRSNVELAGMVNHRLNKMNDRCRMIGYEVFGPIVVSFCQWIHKCKKRYGFEKLFFLARDMRIVYETYIKMYGKAGAEYLCVSRASLKSAADSPVGLCKYLEKMGFKGSVAVVDTGWRGTAQPVLEYYAKMNHKDTEVGGLYMCAKLAYDHIQRSKKSAVCFCETKQSKIFAATKSSLLEAFISSNEKRCVAYNSDGTLDLVGNDKKTTNMTFVQKGITDFANDWLSCGNKLIDRKKAFDSYIALFDNAKAKDIELLFNEEYDDVEISKIVTVRIRKHYLKHPADFFRDLSLSSWKSAFFRGCFKNYKPVYLMYILLDSMYLSFKDVRTFKGISVEELLRQ